MYGTYPAAFIKDTTR